VNEKRSDMTKVQHKIVMQIEIRIERTKDLTRNPKKFKSRKAKVRTSNQINRRAANCHNTSNGESTNRTIVELGAGFSLFCVGLQELLDLLGSLIVGQWFDRVHLQITRHD
jgi:hypothetical protein